MRTFQQIRPLSLRERVGVRAERRGTSDCSNDLRGPSPRPFVKVCSTVFACLCLAAPTSLTAATVKDCILTNHTGFLPQGAKYFVVLNPPAKDFAVQKWGGGVVAKGPLKQVNADLGDGWVGEFSAVRDEGVYTIQCGGLQSRPVVVSRDAAEQPLRVLFNYFPTQRCGDSLTGWHAPCHLDDARRVDNGKHVDLAGGWHQSCDLRKWLFGTPFALAGLSQLGTIKHPRWDNGQIADELRWGNRYFHSMVRTDGGLMDHIVVPVRWDHRDVYPNDPPFCATYLMIVGQAMAGRYLADKDPEHAKKCLEVARRVWQYATDPATPPGPYRPKAVPQYHDWLIGVFDNYYRGSTMERGDALYAALRLFEATQEAAFLDRAYAMANELVALQIGGDVAKNPAAACFRVGPNREELTAASMFGAMGLAELAMSHPEHRDAARWKQAVELMAAQKCAMADRNPWGLIPAYWYANRPGAGRAAGTASYRYFFRFTNAAGATLQGGPNHDAMGNALFLLRVHRLTGQRRYFDTACRQIDWVLGCNPFDASTVEGVGLNQPPRFVNGGEFFPPTPQIPGAVMTGVQGDPNDNPEPFANNCSTEYDMPPTAMLMWMLSELSAVK